MTWEKRWHPLREEWVTITSHRNQRPWSGAGVKGMAVAPAYVEDCYLCPGNARVSGIVNDNYQSVFVFDNDHAAYTLSPPPVEATDGDFFEQAPVTGVCRVVCYAPQHNVGLAELGAARVLEVLNTWAEQTQELLGHDAIKCIFAFENRGEVVGVSNPHPHCQIYATDHVMNSIEREVVAAARYRSSKGRSLFEALCDAEEADGRRIICATDQTLAFVPYFARFPYETYIFPRQSTARLDELDADGLQDLARSLSDVLIRFDNLWEMPFPYIMAVHQAPKGVDATQYQCHIQLHPPMRAPGLQKFLAGVETGGGNFLNDGCPEDKAAELRACSPVHYTRQD